MRGLESVQDLCFGVSFPCCTLLLPLFIRDGLDEGLYAGHDRLALLGSSGDAAVGVVSLFGGGV